MTLSSNSAIDALSPHSKAHRERAALMARLWDYYRGRHIRPLKVKDGQADDNVTLNFSRRVVNKGLAFLFGPGVEFEIDGADTQTPAEEHLGQVWGTLEQKQRILLDLGLNGGVTGQGFLRIYPALQPGDLPRLAVINPSLMDVITSDDDIDDVRSYLMLWKTKTAWKRHRIDVQENGQWLISEEVMERSNRWQLINETPWQWTFPPMFTCQNLPFPNDVWGISDLEEADTNDGINWTASNINRILRFHAHPKTIGIGFKPDKLQNTAIDQFWSIDEPNAKVFNLEMQSDLGSAYQFLQALRETYAKVTGVPSLDPDKINVGQLSGFALRILYSDLLEITDVKHVTYGALLADVNAALLAIGGFGEGVRVNCVWGDPLPASTAEEVQGLTADRANGLSMETYLERRGYDAKLEIQRAADEKSRNSTLGEVLLQSFEQAPL